MLPLVLPVVALVAVLVRSQSVPRETDLPARIDPGARSRPVEPSSPGAAPSTPQPAGAAEAPVLGRVVSARNGAPVAGAELTFGAARGALSTRSGPDGAFRFVPPGPGSYQLAAVLAEGYVPFGPDWGQSPIRFVSPVPAGAPELVVTLEPETRFAGRVERSDGAPLPAATVTLRIPGASGASLASPERSWTTDAQGEFRGTAPEEGVLVARHPGFLPAVVQLRSGRPGPQLVRLVLQPVAGEAGDRSVAGIVLGSEGAPVPGATVTLGAGRGRGGLGWALLPAPVSTDSDGRFRFASVPETAAWVQARNADLLSDPASVPGQGDIVLTLRPGGVLAGRVLQADGRPALAFALRISRLRRAPESQPVTLSVMEPEGRWELRGLRAGAYLLEAAAPGAGSSAPVRVDLPTGASRVERDVWLRRGHTLTGVVRDASTRAPVARAEVALEASPAEDAVLARGDVFSGEDGRFVLDGLPDAPATVTVSADGYNRKLVTLGGSQAEVEVEVLLRSVPTGREPATDLVGIGAVVNHGDQGIVLGTVVPAGGAALAGLAEGDTILRIDGAPVAELGFGAAVQRLRGEEGSAVRLEVRRRDGSVVSVVVTRGAVSF